jgi:hypothetical protein
MRISLPAQHFQRNCPIDPAQRQSDQRHWCSISYSTQTTNTQSPKEGRSTMTTEEMMSTTALNTWKLVVGRFTKGIAPLTEEQLQQHVAPNRNRLMYLLGHLTAVHDRMFTLLDIGERLHPELDDIYITNPDGTHPDPLPAAELKQAWNDVNDKLTAAFEKLTPNEWVQKHTSVSEEDFAKDPTRNRLSVFLSRTTHVAFHAGQAVLVK